MMLISGPFNLHLNDTAEVVMALAGGIGPDYLDSITKLRYNITSANLIYNNLVNEITSGKIYVPNPQRPKTGKDIDNYTLYQNFPNPFNSTTIIRYELPTSAHVTLIVYDILGSEGGKLVDEEKPAGSYSVNFNAGSLPSGIYFYQIRAGEFVSTKKMLLIK